MITIFILFIFTLTNAIEMSETVKCAVKCAKKQIGKQFMVGHFGPTYFAPEHFDDVGLLFYCYSFCGYIMDYYPSRESFLDVGIYVTPTNLVEGDIILSKEGNNQMLYMYVGNGKYVGKKANEKKIGYFTPSEIITSRRIVYHTNQLFPKNFKKTITVAVKHLEVMAKSTKNSKLVDVYNERNKIACDEVILNDECLWYSYYSDITKLRRYVCGRNTTSFTCNINECPLYFSK